MPYPNKIENIYKWGIKILIFLIPFIPLYISTSMLFPYITGKNFAFRILVEFAAFLWLGLMTLNKEYRLRNSIMVISILLFTFIVGLADLFGVSPYNSFWSNYERMEGYITILHLAIYFMIIKSILKTQKDWKFLFNIFVIVSGFVSLCALIIPPYSAKLTQLGWEYGDRVSSTIGNPPFLASYLLLSVFLGLILFFSTQKPVIKYIYILPVILNSGVIYRTASRGPILAGIIGIIIFVVLYIVMNKQVTKEKLFKRALLPFLGVFIILLVVFLIISNTDFIKHDRTLSRFSNIFSDSSVKTRLNTWNMAWEGFKERPILGWGQENFIGVYTVNPIPFVWKQVWLDRAHNIVIHWLINAGILGLFSYLAIFGSVFYILRKAFQKKLLSKKEAVIILTVIVVYFINNLFIFDTINTYVIFFTLLAYVDNINSAQGLSFSTSEVNYDLTRKKIKFTCATVLALLVFCCIFYYINYKPIRQSQLFTQLSINISKYNSFSTLLDDLNKVLSYKTFGDSDVSKGMAHVVYVILWNELYAQEGALEFIKKTVEEFEKGTTFNRHNLEYLTYLIKFYKKIAMHNSSFISATETLIKECMRINPEYQWLYMVMSDVCLLKKDYESAFTNVKKIVEMDPKNDEKQLKLALAAIYTSREDLVKSSLENVKKIRMVKNNNIASGKETVFSAAELYQFAQIYKEIKNFHKALQYFKEIITVLSYKGELYSERDFNFRTPRAEAKIHLEIAETYLILGDKENAVKEAKKAAKLDPAHYAEKAERFIY